MNSVRFMLHVGSDGNVLAELDGSAGPFLVGDVVEIKDKPYRVLGREWAIREAVRGFVHARPTREDAAQEFEGVDDLPPTCSLTVYVMP